MFDQRLRLRGARAPNGARALRIAGCVLIDRSRFGGFSIAFRFVTRATFCDEIFEALTFHRDGSTNAFSTAENGGHQTHGHLT